MKYTFGCDPELFVFNEKTQQFLSALKYVKGTKEKPFPVEGGATQLDGVAAEFNITPVDNEDDWIDNINKVYNRMLVDLPSDCILRPTPVAYFKKEYFEGLSMEEKLLGCSPDYDAYTKKQNIPPSTSEYFRTGSGHIHVGYDTSNLREKGLYESDVIRRVKQLDRVLYFPSLFWDSSKKRRTLYGAAGSFRYKPYGFEYRVLSNAWLQDEDLMSWVFNATKTAMQLYDIGEYLFDEKDEAPAEEYKHDSLVKYFHAITTKYGIPPLSASYLKEDKEAA